MLVNWFKESRKKIKEFFSGGHKIVRMILFTIFILVLINLISLVTMPGLNLNFSLDKNSEKSLEFFNLISILGGNLMNQVSILSLGVSPYITASVMTQLLSSGLVPFLSNWRKYGEKGRVKIEIFQRILMIPLAILQGIALIFSLERQGVITAKWDQSSYGAAPYIFYYFLVIVLIVLGSMICLWFADQINTRGIGNGVSLIIFSGIAKSLPMKIKRTIDSWINVNLGVSVSLFEGLLHVLIYLILFMLIVWLIIFFSQSERRIPIAQAGRRFDYSNDSSTNQSLSRYLPLKINSSGVIPVIFSSALLTIPVSISQWIMVKNPENGFVLFVNKYISLQTWGGNIISFFLIIAFTFIYSQIQIDPAKVSEDFQKNGTYIVGVKQGKKTESYIAHIINMLSFPGSIFLAFIVVLPFLISKLTGLAPNLAIGGTGLIILVGVSIDTLRQIKSYTIQKRFFTRKDVFSKLYS